MEPTRRSKSIAPKEPTAPINPATDPTTLEGKMSAASVCRMVDQNWWPRNAMLKNTSVHANGDLVIRMEIGINAALSPRQILRDKLIVRWLRTKRLLSQPPRKLPAPPAA